MSAVLSPAEQDEVTRFGIHEDDVLRDMAEHMNEELKCQRPGGCDEDAVAVFVLLCGCPASRPGCQRHIDGTIQRIEEFTSRAHRECGQKPSGYRVVPL